MKKLMMVVASASIVLFSCNKENIETQIEDNKNNLSVISGSNVKYYELHWTGYCFGPGVRCAVYPPVIIKPKFTEVMSPVEVQAFFTSGDGASILQELNQDMQAKLTSGNYAMHKSFEDQNIITYTFTYGNDSFALQFSNQ